MARDNFKAADIKKLRDRVAHRCSNPTCRVPTSAPSGKNKVTSIGVAAHITAASEGGARFDQSISSEERSSIDNAIWLCSNCSIDIDRDEDLFTVELLRKWKEKAEERARRELGKKLPEENDAVDMLTSALTGVPKSFLAQAISNVHSATAKSLESIDPRFSFKTKHDGEITIIEVNAKEEVELELKVDLSKDSEYLDKYKKLVEHGQELKIKSEAFSFSGSKLFEEFSRVENGLLTISPNKIKANQKFWLVQNETGIIEQFDDIYGFVCVGTKAIFFEGSACDGIFDFSYRSPLGEGTVNADLKFSISFDSWEGVNISNLPYFDKIFSLFNKMLDGWSVYTALEVNGSEVLRSGSGDFSNFNYAKEVFMFLMYSHRCRNIARAFKLNVDFTSNCSYTAEEHKLIADVSDTLDGKNDYGRDDCSSPASFNVVIDDDFENIDLILDSKSGCSFKMVENEGVFIKLFTTKVQIPPKSVYFNNVLPRIKENRELLEAGDEVTVELTPEDNFRYIVKYDEEK